ncbi:serine/threonine protein kinase [Bifidobacterium sp. CP2]|uniref:serine/threonine protein kinase n=1 Tax=Bifidobacterium sp. CP2 TaxID=2809025 RepID=UPI001BDCD290|nr:serine/threonine-protein kinase [Bifidobacterium sp. CP2]MBT1181899.1 serine/threonine protein kinase [Bifidobacterium sp. CP2]
MDDTQTLHAMMLDDAYHVERTLADGAGGVTELVTLDGTGPFVRKKIPLRLARRRLWSTLADCTSPRLPRVEATYELPDRFVVVYDYVSGVTLDEYVTRRGRLAASEATAIALQLCEAVGELHAHGIIHRDVTPTNIVVSADGAHLIDFGIARERAGTVAGDAARARDTTTLGTWGYAAPEQYGFAPTDARTDVYAIGRVLGFMLTGVDPSDVTVYDRALADDTASPPALRAVIAQACAFEPSARMQTVHELRDALEQAEHGTEGTAQAAAVPFTVPMPPTATDGAVTDGANMSTGVARRASASRRVVAWTSAGLVALLLAGGVGYAAMRFVSAGNDVTATSPTTSPPSTGGDGATSGDDTAGGSDVVEHNPLELVESGWSAENGYVEYALVLRNTNTTHAVRFPRVTITGRDKDGSVMFSDTPTFPLVFAGETAYFSGQSGDGEQPATVDFAVGTPASDDLLDTGGAESYRVHDVKERRTDFGGVTFAGEVTTDRDDDNGKGVYTDDIIVTLVLRDKNGHIVFGRNEYVAKPAKGTSRAFSIETYDLPAYASYEIHAHTS